MKVTVGSPVFWRILFILWLVLITLGIYAKSIRSNEPPQLVFTFDHQRPDGQSVVIIRDVTVAMGWTPVGHPAPLTKGDYLVCAPLSIPVAVRKLDGQDVGPRNEIAFRCGANLYLMTTLDIKPKK